jgi:hypothetical protein
MQNRKTDRKKNIGTALPSIACFAIKPTTHSSGSNSKLVFNKIGKREIRQIIIKTQTAFFNIKFCIF